MFSAKPRRSKPLSWIGRLLGGMVDGFKSFCLQTSIHGFNHIAARKRHWIERLAWVCVTAMAACGAVGISLGQWQRYRNNPTVVTMDKDYRTWNYTMAAATACELNRTNSEKVEKAIKSRWNVAPNDSNYYYYSRFVDVVANSDLYHLEGYEEFRNDPNLNVNLYELAVEVMPDQSVKLSSSGLLSTRPQWVSVMTEIGACYTINSVAVADIAIMKRLFSKPTTNITRGLPATCKYSSEACTFILECYNTIKYYIHSAFDIADTQAAYVISNQSQNNQIILATTETCSGDEIRALSPSRRHCRYFDEPTQPNRQVYCNNICRQECRSRIAVQVCGCKPFYYYFAEGPLCSPAGMSCLAGIAHRLATFDNTTCPCVQSCVDSVFREISALLNMWLLLITYLLVSIYWWDLATLKSRGVVRCTVKPPRTRYTRHIVFHFQDLVVSFGGAAGLFLGASFISFVEIGYFFIERILRIGGKKTDSKTLVKRHRAPPYEARIQELTSILKGQNYYERNYPNYYY